MSESTGVCGSTPDGLGRDKDEDDLEWARRCARMASQMCRPAIKRGIGNEHKTILRYGNIKERQGRHFNSDAES